MDPDRPPVEVKGLTVAYGPLVVMQDLTFQVRRGEVFVIMGDSGSGKSTLPKHLVGLRKPAAGAIPFEGEDFGEAVETGLGLPPNQSGDVVLSGELRECLLHPPAVIPLSSIRPITAMDAGS